MSTRPQKCNVGIGPPNEESLHDLSRGLMEYREFASQIFEHRIHSWRKPAVIACFKLRDL
jgi:hypothetical protein